MSRTQLGDTLSSVSGRPNAQLLKGLQTHCRCTAETTERNWRLWPLSNMLWRSFTFWLIRTQCKLLLMLLSTGLSLITSFFSSHRLLIAGIISRLFEYGLFCFFFHDLLLLLLATCLTIFLIYNSGPREDATRIGSAGVVRRQAVDISPLRRVNQALYLLTTGAREAAFRNIKTIAECLADELINAAKGSSNRFFSFLLGCSFHNCFFCAIGDCFHFLQLCHQEEGWDWKSCQGQPLKNLFRMVGGVLLFLRHFFYNFWGS